MVAVFAGLSGDMPTTWSLPRGRDGFGSPPTDATGASRRGPLTSPTFRVGTTSPNWARSREAIVNASTTPVHKWVVGDLVSRRTLIAADGSTVPIPDPQRLLHLQFRRFAGCPICNTHLQSFVARSDEIAEAEIREVIVFHSTLEELHQYQLRLPMAVIADPDKSLYREFGVESGLHAEFNPPLWIHFPRILWTAISRLFRRPHRLMMRANPAGGVLGLPADLLMGIDGRVLAIKYGQHAYDQWDVDDVLELASKPHPIC
jgi:peroxiredoxin